MPPQQSNTRFGKYELLSRLARGGMAETYRGQLRGAAGVIKPVVIKKVLPHMAEDESFVQGFIQEARLSAQLSHGNIAQVFDFGQVGDDYFLAMEYVPGRTLRQMLDRANDKGFWHLPLPIACFVVAEMLKGLHYAHTRLGADGKPLGLVHRDVSPENVLVSYEGEVKVIDFGVAKAKMRGRQETEPGLVKGKYRYFSPEQAAAKDLDARSDVYAAGVVLYRCLGGRTPYEGQLHVVLRNLLKGEYPQLEELNPSVPGPLATLVDKALKTRREERFKSAGQFGEEVSGFLHKMVPGFSAREVGEWMRWLFPEEAAKEGLSEPPSAHFQEQVAIWKPEPRPEPLDSVSGEMRRGTEQATANQRTPSAFAPNKQPAKPWMVAAGVGALAVLLGVAAFILVAGNQEAGDHPQPVKLRTQAPSMPALPDDSQAGEDGKPDDKAEKAEKAKAVEPKKDIVPREADVTDVAFRLQRAHHKVRFDEQSGGATFELEAGKLGQLKVRSPGDTAWYAVLDGKGGASAVGLLSSSVSLKGPVRVRLFDLTTGPVHGQSVGVDFNGQVFDVGAAALAQGVAQDLLVLRGLRSAATYKLKVRGYDGKKPSVAAVWEESATGKPVRKVLTAGDSLELKGTTAAAFGFVEGTPDEGDAELLMGQATGPIDVPVARGACDKLQNIKRDPEAISFGQLTCSLLPKALAAQQEEEAKAHAEVAIDDLLNAASEKLNQGHYEEGKKVLDQCTRQYLDSCRCPMAWRRATEARHERATGVMWKRVADCSSPEIANGTTSSAYNPKNGSPIHGKAIGLP